MDPSHRLLVRAWSRPPGRGYVPALRLRGQCSPHRALAVRVARRRAPR